MPSFECTEDDAKLPVRGSRSSAGYDVYAYERVDIQSGSDQIVRTGVRAVGMNTTDCLQVYARSGFSCKHGIEVGAGLIDSDYTGEILIHLYNHGSQAFTCEVGERIAQLVCVRLGAPFECTAGVRDTEERGKRGFGSSGTA